jgi:hypothetical protein
MQEPDQRYRRLLRARRERQCGHRSTEPGYELPPFQVECQLTLPSPGSCPLAISKSIARTAWRVSDRSRVAYRRKSLAIFRDAKWRDRPNGRFAALQRYVRNHPFVLLDGEKHHRQ